MTETTPKKLTAEEVLDKIGFDRTFDYLFDKLGTAGILEKMTEQLAIKREAFKAAGNIEQQGRASRMHQILLDGTKRAKLI